MKKIIILIAILLILELNIVQCQILSYEEKLNIINYYLIDKEIEFIEYFKIHYQYISMQLYSMDSPEQIYDMLSRLYQSFQKR